MAGTAAPFCILPPTTPVMAERTALLGARAVAWTPRRPAAAWALLLAKGAAAAILALQVNVKRKNKRREGRKGGREKERDGDEEEIIRSLYFFVCVLCGFIDFGSYRYRSSLLLPCVVF